MATYDTHKILNKELNLNCWTEMKIMSVHCLQISRLPLINPVPVFLCLALLVSACVASPTVSPTSTEVKLLGINATKKPIPTNTPNPLFTHTPLPSHTPTPTLPVSPTQATELTPVWGSWLGTPIVLEGFYGYWSPVSLELVGIQGSTVYTGNLAISSAPDFTIQPFLFENSDQVWLKSTWSPDGKTVLFGIPIISGGIIVDYFSTLWSINIDGTSLKQLPGNYRGLDFPWWMDQTTVVVTSYGGGGHSEFVEIDYLTGEVLVADVIHNFYESKPQGEYLPVVSAEEMFTAHILTRSYQNQSSLCPIESCYTLEFPQSKLITPGPLDTYFEDWLPGKPSALIGVEGYKEGHSARLYLWNIETDDITPFVAGGMNARFSPDGSGLIFATFGPYSEYADVPLDSLILDPVLDPLANEVVIYIQWMSLKDRQVMLSLPAMTWEDYSSNFRDNFNVIANLSPDGHYLAFQSLGMVEIDDQGWPSGINPNEKEQLFVNILDLVENKLLFSIPNPNSLLEMVWAPSSDKLVFPDNSDNWILVDLSKMEVLPLTNNASKQIYEAPAWSYDGRYLSITTRLPNFMEDSSKTRTFIIDLLQP